jgi:formylglycine-generating enzyme required for sulfatase activity
MGTTPWDGKDYVKEGSDYAATYVSWDDAVAFCAALTKRERVAGHLPAGYSYQLPTEAEWEYACRAGTTTIYSFGADSSKLDRYAWFSENAWEIGDKYAHRVATKLANGWNLHDMHGNVYEWCRDGYQEKLPGGADPVGTGSLRVFRGGSWSSNARHCRSAFRRRPTPSNRFNYLGFRLALSPSAQ